MPAPEGNTFAEGKGRPSSYDPAYDELAYKLCLLGHTDAELAQFFGVTETTINNWKEAHLSFFESVRAGKLIADADVAHAYHKRAKGFSYDEVTREGSLPDTDKQADIESVKNELTITKIVTKMYPPEPGAALNWLKNRQPAKWREGFDLNINKGEDIEIWTAEEMIAFQQWKLNQAKSTDGN